MKMSNNLYEKLKKEVKSLSEKTDLKSLKSKMLMSGNSETRFNFDVFYMIQAWDKFGQDLHKENLNDSHINTAMKNILSEVIC